MSRRVTNASIDTNALSKQPLIIIVMGVSGCGKSTAAAHIAGALEARGLTVHGKDGDELHPSDNIRKMASGKALTDEDRQPWLEKVAAYARDMSTRHRVCVIACSALKRQYREILNTAGRVIYIFLEGSHDIIASRMRKREGHFMPVSLLDSQFATLEDPRNEPNVLTVSAEPAPEEVAANAIALLVRYKYLHDI